MPSDDLQKHTLNLFAGDYEKLQALYPDHGAGPIIRSVVRKFIEQCESANPAVQPNVETNL
jgi:hypothetical protein